MSEEELAVIEAPVQKIREMVEKTALAGRGEPYHSDIYVNVHPAGVVNTLASSKGNVVTAYGTYATPYLDKVESEQEEGTQANLDVVRFLSYLDFASDGGDIRLAFRGDADAELASVLEIYGALNIRIMLTVGEKALEDVPTGLPERFNDDEQMLSSDGERTMPTTIDTTAEEMQRLIEVVDYDPETTFYPVTVSEGELSLDIGRDGGRDAVWGELSGEVDSPKDLQNYYGEGFVPIFRSLSGDVNLQTAPGGAPLVVVQTAAEGITCRHVVGNISE